jgi:GNAT superfamily N-acetyltransferase
VRFATYDELTPGQEVDRALLQLAAFGGAFPARAIELWRRRSKTLADYVGLFAIDRGRVVGQAYVLRIPFTFRDGVEIVSGLAGVTTRPDRGRTGIARRVLEEIHQREREAGVRYITLWTNRSWGAHRLYELLGYRDVYSSPWAVRYGPTGHGPGSRPRGIRPARRSDLGRLERLHAAQARGRLGFCRPAPGYLRTAAAAGEVVPGEELLVAGNGGRVGGYAHIERSRLRTICGELVASSSVARRALIEGVLRSSRGAPVAFQHSVVTDHPELFRPPTYSLAPSAWLLFMAAPLGAAWTTGQAIQRFATTDPRFLCHAGDRF